MIYDVRSAAETTGFQLGRPVSVYPENVSGGGVDRNGWHAEPI